MAMFRSKRVYVVGEVNKPGNQDITDIPMTVLEAVNRAGGFSAEADYSRVLLTRRGTTYRVDIQAMYEDGATEQNAMLEPGDIVNVSDRSYNKIFVLGEVIKPGSMVMNKNVRRWLKPWVMPATSIRKNPARAGFTSCAATATPRSYSILMAAHRTPCCSPTASRYARVTSSMSTPPTSFAGTASSPTCCQPPPCST